MAMRICDASPRHLAPADARAIWPRMEVHADEEEWLASRRRRAPSTDLVALLGLSPYRSPWDVWEEYHGTPREPSEETRAIWQTGHELEPAICAHVGGVQASAVMGGIVTLQHECYPIQASPDGIARLEDGRVVGVEAKTDRQVVHQLPDGTGRRYTFAWGPDQTIPQYIPVATRRIVRLDHLAQVYITMSCCDAPAWWLVVLGAGLQWHQYLILRDETAQSAIVGRAWWLWQHHILDGVEPDPDESDACTRAALRDWSERIEREATAREATLARDYAEHRAAARYHDREARAAKNALLATVRGPHRLTVPPDRNDGRWGRVTISTTGRITATHLTQE